MQRFVLLLGAFSFLATGPSALATAGSHYTYNSWLSPQDPFVGETYGLYITVRNTSNRPIVFVARVVELPGGDQLLSSAARERWVGAGQTSTFRFDIYCGVRGGTVRYTVSARWGQ